MAEMSRSSTGSCAVRRKVIVITPMMTGIRRRQRRIMYTHIFIGGTSRYANGGRRALGCRFGSPYMKI